MMKKKNQKIKESVWISKYNDELEFDASIEKLLILSR
jgi:hypothetical protein